MRAVEGTSVRSSVLARPTLFGRLSAAEGVALVSAPAGSGKTILVRTWIEATGLVPRTAWVSVERSEHDPQRFWLAVVDCLRQAIGTNSFVEPLGPAPEFDGDALIPRLAAALGSLDEPVVLVIDDLHELASADARGQLERLIAHRPALLRIVLVTRHDPGLGLHRLRLAGQLVELRASDLRLTLAETRELLAGSGVALPDAAAARLLSRTEGWVAGLRLAALSLAGHSDPEQFVAEFSGSERTVADYLLAEVLRLQTDAGRRLLLRTSILDRVNGALADRLTGATGSAEVLFRLEEENAFVVALDAERTWFRYHQLFADLLRLELRRTDAPAMPDLHRTAAAWFAEHGDVVEAVRHAQAAEDWAYAARMLADHIFSLSLNGHNSTIATLLDAFPSSASNDPELAVVIASRELSDRSLEAAEDYLSLAERRADEVPAERRAQFGVSLAATRLALARRRGDFETVLGEFGSLLAVAEPGFHGGVLLSSDARAIALMNLGIAEYWSVRYDDGVRHLRQGLELARRIGRPYVEIACLSHLALAEYQLSIARLREHAEAAIAIAEANGWSNDPISSMAFATMGAAAVSQGRFEEARSWLDRAAATLRRDLEPATAVLVDLARGVLHAGEGRLDTAAAAFEAAERLQVQLVSRHVLTLVARQFLLQTQLRAGRIDAAKATLGRLNDGARDSGEVRTAVAALDLAENDAAAARTELAPVLGGTAPVVGGFTVMQALLLDAVARDRTGDARGAESDIERALDLAEPDGLILPFLMVPAREILERHPGHRTRHGAFLGDILGVLAGSAPAARPRRGSDTVEDLSESELRVLRYLPSNLSASEIGSELFVSTSTVKTHMRHVYAKLAVHRRTEAVERARELGFLGASTAIAARKPSEPRPDHTI